MFYPGVFPKGTDLLPVERILGIEAYVMRLLVVADRGYFRHVGREGSFPGTVDELLCSGASPFEEQAGLAALMDANAEPFLRFVTEQVMPSDRHAHWEWLEPDWERVRQHLGQAAAGEWQQKLAGWKEETMEAVA